MVKTVDSINWDKEYNVFAWDSGYDQDKVITDNGEKIISPSVTEKVASGAYANRISEHSKFSKDKMLIRYNGEEYRVGEFAINVGASGGKKNFEDDRFKNVEEHTRLFSLVAALNPNKDTIKINILMLGLPIATYQKFKKEIVKVYKGKLFEFEVPDKDGNFKTVRLYIKNCNVVPQGVGMYYDYTLNKDGRPKSDDLVDKQYAVLDIGGKTVDGYISYGKNNIIPETVVPVERGITDAFKEVSKKLNNAPYTKIQKNYIGGKETIYWNGEHKFKNLCEDEFKTLAEDIYSTVHNAWVRYLPGTEFILLGGGGGEVVKEHLSYLFSNKVILIDDPQMSNARGYLKLGIYAHNRNKN